MRILLLGGAVVLFATGAVAATGDRGGSKGNRPRNQAVTAAKASRTPSASRYDRRLAAMKRRLSKAADADAFTFVVQPPFVIAGDEAPAEVRQRAEHTIKWASGRLKQKYFAHDPGRIIEIWLFAGDASYRDHARALFGDEPDTPYGYYSPSHDAMIMNISTGGGTLVHELVHPYVEANLVDCPPWFNEGLASLYEASAEVGGEIVGLVNWRLPGLQRALTDGEPPALRTLLGLTSDEFYGDASGLDYAKARYLLYWLQERGELDAFYQAFQTDRGDGGMRALLAATGLRERALERTWKAFVLGLRWAS